MGDCVVRHCHLYPLYSWQDILLTFAEMEPDSTTRFTPGTNVISSAPQGNLFWRRLLDIQSTVMHIAASLMSIKARHCVLSFCSAISVPESVRVRW